MHNHLSPENEHFLEHAISVGMYHDRDEALDRAVELLRRRELLILSVNKGIEKVERGEGAPLDIEQNKTAVQTRLETP